ncbi:MAG: NTP transferase domain-containing protein [Candidatus Pacebacteria bacterium]|nr:NTP transferase domain-containing protein [Candidatus Paceibacterota bacterium]
MQNDTKIVILAAGKGTRMKSDLPKALMKLGGNAMITHLLKSVAESGIDTRPIIVVGYQKEKIMAELGDKYIYAVQTEQLGTGHAVSVTQEACGDAKNIIVISGDQPYIKAETLKNLLAKHLNSKATVTITTTQVPDFSDWRVVFTKFGRIIREDGKIVDREWKDASETERNIKELNISCYAFNAHWFWNNFSKIDKESNVQKEYYLTDLWQIASESNEKVESITIDPREALGADSKEELETLEKLTS